MYPMQQVAQISGNTFQKLINLFIIIINLMYQYVLKETDGIVENFLNLVWVNDVKNYHIQTQSQDDPTNTTHKLDKISLNIPETVIFKEGMPISWFFTSLDGKLKKRKRECLNPKQIEQRFLNKHKKFKKLSKMNDCEIVAYLLRDIEPKQSQNKSKQKIILNQKVQIVYMNSSQLKKFLHEEKWSSKGILQLFIPCSQYDTILHMFWSPGFSTFSLNKSKAPLSIKQINPYERGVIFDNLEIINERIPIIDEQIVVQLGNLATMMTDRIKLTMYGNSQSLNRVNLHFKKFRRVQIDKQGNKKFIHIIYFLWATGARLGDKSPIYPLSNYIIPSQKKIDTRPSHLHLIAKLDPTLKNRKSSKIKINIIRNKCPNCEKEVVRDLFTNISIKMIYEAHFRQLSNIKKALVSEHKVDNICMQKMNMKTFIPKLILKLNQGISLQKSQQIRKHHFCQTIKICYQCYYLYTFTSPQAGYQHVLTDKHQSRNWKKITQNLKQNLTRKKRKFFQSQSKEKAQDINYHQELKKKLRRVSSAKSFNFKKSIALSGLDTIYSHNKLSEQKNKAQQQASQFMRKVISIQSNPTSKQSTRIRSAINYI